MLDKIKQIFGEEYPEVKFDCSSRNFGSGELYAFFLKFKNESDLRGLWKVVSNTIAITFQTQLKDDFAKWNTYIFFSIDFEINRELKYTIENNKFSSRKIIVEEAIDPDDVIDKYIFDKCLKEAMSIPIIPMDAFIKNNTIEEALGIKTVREKKVKTEVALSVLDDLYNTLKEESNEI